MAAFTEAIKVLLEKRIVPTVMGLVCGVFIYAVTPGNNWLLNKIGKSWYVLFWAGVCFLIITFIQFMIKKGSEWLELYDNHKEAKAYEDKRELETMEELWSFMDRQNQENMAFIRIFLDNGNKIVEKPIDFIPGYIQEYFAFKPIIIMRQVEYEDGYKMQYRLDKDFYALLEVSKRKYKRISHFE